MCLKLWVSFRLKYIHFFQSSFSFSFWGSDGNDSWSEGWSYLRILSFLTSATIWSRFRYISAKARYLPRGSTRFYWYLAAEHRPTSHDTILQFSWEETRQFWPNLLYQIHRPTFLKFGLPLHSKSGFVTPISAEKVKLESLFLKVLSISYHTWPQTFWAFPC